jgi:hypothetical protein
MTTFLLCLACLIIGVCLGAVIMGRLCSWRDYGPDYYDF